MKKSLFALTCFLVAPFLSIHSAFSAEVFEIGEHNFDQLPRGKEADGIVGDFVLRNDKIEVTIAGNLPLRRANMGTYYGDGNETPGCLYDLTRRGEANDQITIFSPLGQKGQVNHVRIIEDGSSGRAVIETYTSSAKAGGIAMTHTYILEDGWEGVLIVSQLQNDQAKAKPVSLKDGWSQMRSKGTADGVLWADAVDPADKCGYAYAWVEEGEAKRPAGSQVELKFGDKITVARFLAVGRSPAEAVGIVQARKVKTGVLSLSLMEADGSTPVTTASVSVFHGESEVRAYPDKNGKVMVALKPGVRKFAIHDIGRASISEEVEITDGKTSDLPFKLGPQAGVKIKVTDAEGGAIPCKVQFNAIGGTAKPNLGPTDRAHGCVDQWHSENGNFRTALPPGKYRVVITRGPEFSHHMEEIELGEGDEASIETKLVRLVDTSGWVSTDFHNHSTPSGDNTCGTDDRLINIAAEQIEFAPTTEHNRLYDWEPHINKLGLSAHIKTIPGMELTGRGAHFNMFPLKPDPMKQDGGAPVWQKDPRLNALVLRNFQGEEPDRWVHLNHPDMAENFFDWNKDGRVDGGYAYFGGMLNGLETQNYRGSGILAEAPFTVGKARTGLGKQVSYVREYIWLQLLNQGVTVWGIGVADAHHVFGNGVGSWRTYVPSSTDEPEKIDWKEITRNAKAGRMVLSSGPFLEVETESGIVAGGYDRVSGQVNLKVKVQCTDWIDVDRIQVLVNGRQDPDYNYTREKNPELFSDGVVKFQRTIPVKLSQDAHLIVVAIGENETLRTGFGSSTQSNIQPCAYNNPIFIDVDGGGFKANYDTLGFPLPTHKLSVEKVEALLGK